MVTPLSEIDRRHLIVIQGYHDTHAGHVFQALINDFIADEIVINDSAPSYIVVEHGKAVHSKNRGVLVSAEEGATISIIDRDNPNIVLHSVSYGFGTYTALTKQ